ncbi:MAG TPA: hypothetical protein VLV48_01835 [Thermoanaerobaculia bacterium]|nr:hypothetical protein [Thermoanaerobaculia bacterium]
MSRNRGSIAHPARALAALLAVLALVSLVHSHPLFEDSSSESLRGAANQCAACATGAGALPEPGAEPSCLDCDAPATPEPATAILPGGGLRVSIPRAPPC